ncbi:hypothetical protein BJ508DRAFT_417390 [Ascobolus immersus RN42]|uniref:Uncharacterized protein n=1 Tax=Ascobolus immersus RN42 TaxID=1160509 RepID=A0A3N4HSR5_ASCIM|nr:hypothetical protein BJ508DRAFT_417390 [Ascobolus immersus RN42]
MFCRANQIEPDSTSSPTTPHLDYLTSPGPSDATKLSPDYLYSFTKQSTYDHQGTRPQLPSFSAFEQFTHLDAGGDVLMSDYPQLNGYYDNTMDYTLDGRLPTVKVESPFEDSGTITIPHNHQSYGDDIDDLIMADPYMNLTNNIPLVPQEPLVCYGTLERLPVMVSHGVSYIPEKFPTQQYIDLDVTYYENLFSLTFLDGAFFSVLGIDVSETLAPLMDNGLLQKIEGYIARNTITNNGAFVNVEISIVLYGFQSTGAAVAEALQDAGLYLQAPIYYDVKIPYVHPQGYDPTKREDMPYQHNPRTQTKVSTDLQKLLPEVWKGAKTTFKAMVFSKSELGRLRTTLLPHQVEAVSFMRHQEECGEEHIKKKIKSESFEEDDEEDYQLGGILADEMGLGKSLSTLALIGTTLPEWEKDSEKEQKPSGRVTLLITPTSTLASWKDQINEHIHDKGIRTLYYYGTAAERQTLAEKFDDYDLVVTSYATVSTDWKKGLLHDRTWHRIVLDEAHYIREVKTTRCKAITALKARRKWCLSGTPIQNRISDLSGLFSFLQMDPISNNEAFKRQIAVPLRKGQPIGLDTLRETLEELCLRRTRDTIVLPPREELMVKLSLVDEDRQIYDACREQSRKVLKRFLHQVSETKKKPAGSGSSILQSITRQRQLCDHGIDLLPRAVGNTLLERVRYAQEADDDAPLPTFCDKCNAAIIASEEKEGDKKSAVFDACSHTVCADCLPTKGEAEKCPICDEDETPETEKKRKKAISAKEWLASVKYTGPSVKVKALLDNLRRNKAAALADKSKPIKSVVFSFWTRMLYLIQIALKEQEIEFVQLDGSLNLAQREDVLRKFATDGKVTVLLMTIGSGSVGLNLTMASDVHLMEPQWNPMVEAQALDRVHRLGQTRNVTATKYIIEDSFEESILALQKKKVDLAKMSLGGKENSEQMKKRIEDLLEVFK